MNKRLVSNLKKAIAEFQKLWDRVPKGETILDKEFDDAERKARIALGEARTSITAVQRRDALKRINELASMSESQPGPDDRFYWRVTVDDATDYFRCQLPGDVIEHVTESFREEVFDKLNKFHMDRVQLKDIPILDQEFITELY